MSETPTVRFKLLDNFSDDLELPSYESVLAAGADIRASTPEKTPIVLAPGERGLIPTGFAMALPPGYEAQIRPRSGLAFKHGVTCLNTPGTIDADYRGEVRVLLINHGSEAFRIEHGERIAQMVIAPITQPKFVVSKDLDDTARGEGGFGSTGRK